MIAKTDMSFCIWFQTHITFSFSLIGSKTTSQATPTDVLESRQLRGEDDYAEFTLKSKAKEDLLQFLFG